MRATLLLFGLLALPLVGGCGGAGVAPVESTARGRLSVNVRWPRPIVSRVIPRSAKSLRIELWASGAKVAERLVVAPATSANFDGEVTGPIEARVEAFAEPEGTGTPVARGTGTGTFVAGEDSSVAVTLASTVTRIEGYPSAHYGYPGDTSDFEILAEDADANPVAHDPADTLAVSAHPAIASVDAFGVVNLKAEGETTITLTDVNSGLTTELHVYVEAPVP